MEAALRTAVRAACPPCGMMDCSWDGQVPGSVALRVCPSVISVDIGAFSEDDASLLDNER